MSKQILKGLQAAKLSEVSRYLVIYIPFDEEMCSYTDEWMGELRENNYPLVSKGMWSAVIDLKTHKLLNWKQEYGSLYFQAKVCDSGTYFLLDKDKTAVCKIAGYVPNGLIPEADDCGDYIRLKIKDDGTIENWPSEPDFSDFSEDAEIVGKIDSGIEEVPLFDLQVELTYSQLMAKLLRLPKHLQLEIGKALIANAAEEE